MIPVPAHMRTGLIRLYAAILIPWVAYFGNEAHNLYSEMAYSRSALDKYQSLEPDSDPTIKSELSTMLTVWDAATKEQLGNKIFDQLSKDADELTNVVYALLASVVPVPLYFIVIWVLSGFRKRTSSVTG